MEYVHVRKLEEYHPGYKDRELQWCKAYFKMLNADPDFEMLDETDRWRFLAFVMLELQIKKPIPLNEDYLRRKGFDLKKRPISATIKMLHNSLEVVTQQQESVWPRVRVDIDKEEDKDKEPRVAKKRNGQLSDEDFLKSLKTNPAYAGADIDQELLKMDAWILARPGRTKTRRFVVNWLNRKDLLMPKAKVDTSREIRDKKRKEEEEKARKEREEFEAYSQTPEYQEAMCKHKETMKALSQKMGIKK